MISASELSWNGGKEVMQEYQPATNRMGRVLLGAFQTTQRGIVAAKSCFARAKAHLNHRGAQFAQRLYARPQGGHIPEILGRENSALTAHLKAATTIGLDRTADPQEWSAAYRFRGWLIVDERAACLQTACEWSRPDNVRTEGPR